ncbi:MAG: DUF4296 domain-containing protein [Rikenellaceae bacterium]|nr:DUF4296 domain-containing protein [Rikenellaceae bacterium]
MKNILYILIIVLSLVSCRKHKTIPERKMSELITDIMIANSYSSQFVENMNMDSFDIYTPILDRYGYSAEDFKYSLNKIATRKSSRLSEILDDVIDDIKERDNYFKQRERTIKYMDSIIIGEFIDTIYTELSPFVVDENNLKNKNRLVLPAEPGIYYVSYHYLLDSADANNFVTMRYTLIDTVGRSRTSNTPRLNVKGKWQPFDFSLVADDGIDSLSITFLENTSRLRKAKITIDSIYITWHKPLVILREEVRQRFIQTGWSRYINIENEEQEYIGPLYLLPEEGADAENDSDV